MYGYGEEPQRGAPPLHSEKIVGERKIFFLDLKENDRGRFIKITEDVRGVATPSCCPWRTPRSFWMPCSARCRSPVKWSRLSPANLFLGVGRWVAAKKGWGEAIALAGVARFLMAGSCEFAQRNVTGDLTVASHGSCPMFIHACRS
ncbi:hypothetical protein [Verrucomicrobium spinosum]|uniref:hypothetical protein n=1 Tax=Verrucomicrobium spinosum TaxID=2736 RepID=UPI00210C4109|nr:hypothetical protein [Verrucomicrobium spinosum]